MKKRQQQIFNIIRDDHEVSLPSSVVDWFIIILIIVNTIFIIGDTFNLPSWYRTLSAIVETFSVAVFTLEYILRIWTAPLLYPSKTPFRARLRYITSFMAVIDFLSILPFYLPFVLPVDLRVLRSLRILRLLRVFKVGRYTNALDVIIFVFKKKFHQLLSSLIVVFLLMVIASVMMFNVESAAQPDKFNNAFSAFWWSVSTITTVGYGDLYPITPVGQFLGAVIAFLGIAIVAVPTGIISAGFVEAINIGDLEDTHPLAPKPEDEKHYCPYCGKKISD